MVTGLLHSHQYLLLGKLVLLVPFYTRWQELVTCKMLISNTDCLKVNEYNFEGSKYAITVSPSETLKKKELTLLGARFIV